VTILIPMVGFGSIGVPTLMMLPAELEEDALPVEAVKAENKLLPTGCFGDADETATDLSGVSKPLLCSWLVSFGTTDTEIDAGRAISVFFSRSPIGLEGIVETVLALGELRNAGVVDVPRDKLVEDPIPKRDDFEEADLSSIDLTDSVLEGLEFEGVVDCTLLPSTVPTEEVNVVPGKFVKSDPAEDKLVGGAVVIDKGENGSDTLEVVAAVIGIPLILVKAELMELCMNDIEDVTAVEGTDDVN